MGAMDTVYIDSGCWVVLQCRLYYLLICSLSFDSEDAKNLFPFHALSSACSEKPTKVSRTPGFRL